MLREIFKANKNIIVNTDIDGILSAVILCKYCGCKIVGFTNSKDTVWLADGYDDLYSNVYIDMFVTNNQTICIDQHVVAVTNAHMQQIRGLKTKFSPQSDDVDNLRIFTSTGFKHKYPFGTFQYLIAQLESEGVEICLPDLHTQIPYSEIKLGDLVHRVDDSMKTSLCTYRKNACFWWDWLLQKSPNGCIKVLKSYLDELGQQCDTMVANDGIRHKKEEFDEQRERVVKDIKEKTKSFFKNQFNCRTSDGGFNNITDKDDMLLANIEKYITTVASLLELDDIMIPKHYNIHRGMVCRTRWLPIFQEEFLKSYKICGHNVFSYAFIYGPDNDGQTNFSFTIDME